MTPTQITCAIFYADAGQPEMALRILMLHPTMFEHYLPTLRGAWLAGALEAINGATPHITAEPG